METNNEVNDMEAGTTTALWIVETGALGCCEYRALLAGTIMTETVQEQSQGSLAAAQFVHGGHR
ncbi:MAG: hypothetical protein WCT04_14065 [Planctomycetota bacterium]